MNKRLIIVILAFVAAAFILRGLFFEKVTVPDINWARTYRYEGKEARDLWLFTALLRQQYGAVSQKSVVELKALKTDSSLIVMIAGNIKPQVEDIAILFDKIMHGVNMLICGNDVNFSNYVLGLESEHYFYADGLYFDTEEKRLEVSFFTASMDEPSRTRIQELDIKNQSYKKESGVMWGHYLRDGMPLDSTILLSTELDSQKILVCYDIGEGRICFHHAPYLFTNIASEQEFFKFHYNRVMGFFPGVNQVFLTKPNSINEGSGSLFKYFLAYRSFRWAYYLILITVLLFIFFKGKRIQKIIPLSLPKENTSVEFVGTVSRLYQAQNSRSKLAQKMKANFIFFVEDKYNIFPNDKDYWLKLQKKSKVDEALLKVIEKDLGDITKIHTRVNVDLSKLHGILSKFYKTIR